MLDPDTEFQAVFFVSQESDLEEDLHVSKQL